MNAKTRPPSPHNDNLAWVDVFRAIAITGVFSEHWLDSVKYSTDGAFAKALSLWYHSGMLVQLFFVLSAYGLTRSLLNRDRPVKWGQWLWRRLRRVIVPYWIAIVVTFFAKNLIANFRPEWGINPVSLSDLLAYLTFTRNHFPESWGMNFSFWFMPVIIGLYLSFPLLFAVYKRTSPLWLFAICLAVSTATTLITVLIAGPIDHQATIFFFHLVPFAIGMLLADIEHRSGKGLEQFGTPTWCGLGAVLIAVAWALSKKTDYGSNFNDGFTAAGAFLGSMFLFRNLVQRIPPLALIMQQFGRASYPFYLIHLPIIEVVRGWMEHIYGEAFSPFAIATIGLGVFVSTALASIPLQWFIDSSREPK